MKKSRSTVEQIAYALNQVCSGCRLVSVSQMGIAEVTFYVWRKKHEEWVPSS